MTRLLTSNGSLPKGMLQKGNSYGLYLRNEAGRFRSATKTRG